MFRKNCISCVNLLGRNYSTSVKPQLQVYVSGINDPHTNSSIEEWIFRKNDPTKQTLYMWQNGPAVMLGRNQNPYKECNLQNIEQGI